MFKSAATKIAHNTTIPALAGHSDLRPLQDLITAEKTVLTSLQKLKADLAKAADALRIWGQGEGEDLGDVLAASATMLAHFATALATYSSLHHAMRDTMKSVRTREEALDDLRRRRRRVGSSAEAAEKKLHRMSPEHKNLGAQTEILNRLRDEMRAIEGEIIHDETELGDYKRKCTKDWMGLKFGGLVECCEKGVTVGDFGRRIIQSIPEDVTQPGFPRAYYNAHSRVGDLVNEAQRAVSQVAFSGEPSGQPSASAPVSQPPAPEVSAQSPFLPTPSLGSELTLGVTTYNPPPGPPPGRRTSVDELGMHAPLTPKFSSLPPSKERDTVPSSSSVGAVNTPTPATLPLSAPYDGGVPRTEENQSLFASIQDALSQTQHGFTLEDANSFGHAPPDEPVPKYEPLARDMSRSPRSEPHGPMINGHVNAPMHAEEREAPRRAARRSTSPPCLPPGAAPAAVRAWDERMGQGEDGAHSDRPTSPSAGVPSQRRTSSSELDGEEEDGLAYDRDERSLRGGDGGEGKHGEEDASLSDSGGDGGVNATAYESATSIRRSVSGAPPLSRGASQWRIPRVPPPAMDGDANDVQQPHAHERQSSTGTGAQGDEEQRTGKLADEQELNAAAAREVSREMDALVFSAIAPRSTLTGYATPRAPPPGYVSALSAPNPGIRPRPPGAGGQTPQNSTPPSPILPPNPPFANRGRSPMIEARYPGHASSESLSGRISAPVPTIATSGAASPTSPNYRSPPPEYPRPTPPFSSSLMERSTSSLDGAAASPGGPRTISAAAFRRQQMRSPSGTVESGPADTSPLTLRKPSGSPAPRQQANVNKELPRARLAVANPDRRGSDEEGESAGYGAGRYVSDLEGR